ncbi:MAG TPA: hypothetical protein VEH81_03595 [Ktedonobacteraceae bacterium]|nr:hypothetical protein [Ktedonobacteraceae bacterium]
MTYQYVTRTGGGYLKVAETQFRSSIFPRVAAAIVVFLLIGSISLVCVGAVALVGPMFSHGDNVVHAGGKIVSIGPGRDFVLETASGHRFVFQCTDQCRASLGHMQRHLRELAHTDVYYIQGPDNSLMALDVD